MSKKDYEAIARIFATHPAIRSAEVKTLGFNLADYFAMDNPRFDRARFLAAAGVYDLDSQFTEDWQEESAFASTTGDNK